MPKINHCVSGLSARVEPGTKTKSGVPDVGQIECFSRLRCINYFCFYFLPIDTPSRSAWEDDEDVTPLKKSSWDLPTPKVHSREFDRRNERSERSYRSSRDSERSHKRYSTI